jgi:hypothetical protein
MVACYPGARAMSVNSESSRLDRRRYAARGIRIYGEPAHLVNMRTWALFAAACLLLGVLLARLVF